MELVFFLFGSALVFSIVYGVFMENLHRIFALIGGVLIQGALYCLLKKGYIIYWGSHWDLSDSGFGGHLGRSLGEFIGSTIAVSFPLLIALIIHILIAVRNIFRKTPNELYLIVQEEIENGTFDKSLWAEAFCRASGDKEKAKQIYIKLRIKRSR